MRIVAQNHINVDDECRECGSGPRKNFVPGAGYFRKHAVAWTANERNFELTLHEEKRPDAPVLGFACGRIKPVHMVDLAGVVELIGVKEAYRGRGLAIRMHEFIMKMTALPRGRIRADPSGSRSMAANAEQDQADQLLCAG